MVGTGEPIYLSSPPLRSLTFANTSGTNNLERVFETLGEVFNVPDRGRTTSGGSGSRWSDVVGTGEPIYLLSPPLRSLTFATTSGTNPRALSKFLMKSVVVPGQRQEDRWQERNQAERNGWHR